MPTESQPSISFELSSSHRKLRVELDRFTRSQVSTRRRISRIQKYANVLPLSYSIWTNWPALTGGWGVRIVCGARQKSKYET